MPHFLTDTDAEFIRHERAKEELGRLRGVIEKMKADGLPVPDEIRAAYNKANDDYVAALDAAHRKAGSRN